MLLYIIRAMFICLYNDQRTYGFMAILGFTTTILVTWEGVLLVFNIGLVKYVLSSY
jgi:hypothetical protein